MQRRFKKVLGTLYYSPYITLHMMTICPRTNYKQTKNDYKNTITKKTKENVKNRKKKIIMNNDNVLYRSIEINKCISKQKQNYMDFVFISFPFNFLNWHKFSRFQLNLAVKNKSEEEEDNIVNSDV